MEILRYDDELFKGFGQAHITKCRDFIKSGYTLLVAEKMEFAQKLIGFSQFLKIG